MPKFYQIYLKSQLEPCQYLLLSILIELLQSIKMVKLEALAAALPLPIQFESRRHRLQRFLSLPILKVEKLWFPFIKKWLETDFPYSQVLCLAIDRTNWVWINLLMISLIWDKRAIPIYFELLPKKGSTNYEEQFAFCNKVLHLFRNYKTVVLGDREFCSVKLANWLAQKGVYFCLRLKQNEYVQLDDEVWVQLKDLGLSPGISLYLEGVNVTKQKGFERFNLARSVGGGSFPRRTSLAKWKKKYQGWAPDEGWFILTNLESLDVAIRAYKKRFEIEEMFRDLKSGGYNLEGTLVTDFRLRAIILLIMIAYTTATFQGKKIKRMGLQKYVGRVKEFGRTVRRHSSFYIGLYGQNWVNFIEQCADTVAELMRLTRNKWKYYQRGLRAKELRKVCISDLLVTPSDCLR